MEKGTTNLTTIRESLKNCEEVELPYDFEIGENNFNQIFGNNGDLNGYESVRPMMIINNQDVSINYLLDLIQMNNNGEINIIEVEIE